VSTLYRGMAEGTAVNKFDPHQQKIVENIFEGGKWTIPGEKLSPGEGAIVFNPGYDYRSVRFMGSVMGKHLMTPIPAGLSIRSPYVPLPGRLDTDLGFPLVKGDVITLWDREKQTYVSYPFDEDWEKNPVVLGVGESFWIAKEVGSNWRSSPVMDMKREEPPGQDKAA
jgi:hypothetical protein